MLTISRKQKMRFVPSGERGKDRPATFITTPLTLSEEESLLDSFSGQGEVRADHRLINKVFRQHVTGWENIEDDDGVPVACGFDKEGLDDESVASIGLDLRAEVFTFLLSHASVRGEEEKEKSA